MTITLSKNPSTKEVRQVFLDFYASKGHEVVASSALVPHGDPTLLFTNAGMNQFKDVFLGFDKRNYTRATSSQKCVRAGGKHNDLENVGYTARHHTFFEMLGNFSFGDYFKQDAIQFAWELLTEVYKLPVEKLLVTVYADDDEAFDIWHKEIGLPTDKIIRIGDNKGTRYASDNFWMMGDTGPCGPCSEIFYDHGEHIAGGPPGSPDEDGDRFIEIWNNVFMQYNRDDAGVMHPLPKPSVDTGMGLERISAVLQGVHANYEIDLFQALIKAAARETNTKDLAIPSLKVIADHIRACAFLIVDGVIPGNEGRGYVLRRIIRRAVRHGYKLGARKAFFHKMLPDLVTEMGEAYPDLTEGQTRVADVLKQEEVRFFETIESGMNQLEFELSPEVMSFKNYCELQGYINIDANGIVEPDNGTRYLISTAEDLNGKRISFHTKPHESTPDTSITFNGGTKLLIISNNPNFNSVANANDGFTVIPQNKVLDGEVAFKLHDTYGFPLDLTADICRERDLSVNSSGFDAAMARQKDQARAAGKFKMTTNLEYNGAATTFHGYDKLETKATVLALYKDGAAVDTLNKGDTGVVVLDDTPFYAESGGQVGDSGELRGGNSIFTVKDTQKIQANVFGHQGTLTGNAQLSVGDKVIAQVNTNARNATMRNHSATHLMHKALKEVLGEHVQQKGSLVDTDKTRFDFVHNAPMTNDEIRQVEKMVNTEIFANQDTQARVMDIESAQATGAMMLFGEKYGDEVRVLDIGSSRELCGGTHVNRTGDIGLFSIVAEGGVAAGVRRVEAVTAQNALSYMQSMETTLGGVAGTLKVLPAEVPTRVNSLIDNVKKLERELSALKGKLASSQGDDLATQAKDIAGVKVLAAFLEGADANTLRETMDKLKDKLKSAMIVLASVNDGKVSIAAGVTKDLIGKVKAGELVNHVATQVGGKGGGKPEMAMAGGSDAAKLPEALASVEAWVTEKLS